MGVVCRVHKRDPWQCGCYRLDYVGPGVSVVLLSTVCIGEGCDVGLLGTGRYIRRRVLSCCIRKGCLVCEVRVFSGYVHTGEVLKVLSECM